ncbi:DUF4304 domain-containing protein [Rhodoferax sp. AJA081-3]|uniref:DUF4304 domain-containing protein n=1 Tax=Rhodoferax sp. AJA081-3 TaxID=2752316 RepID=UPI001AE06A59|nr:DUF4304 domain-containing protein [Rhodoferax sp. AJA081-3]QTN28808.1 DUF4304 domain-containing protein [Rhodoferax sp. AJA081-3]
MERAKGECCDEPNFVCKQVSAMMEKTTFKKAIGGVLKAARFANNGQSWFLDGDDSIVVLNLQKSDFDDKYYVNLGIWLKSLGAVAFPAENKCHIQVRLTSLFPGDAEMIEGACSGNASDEDLRTFVEFLRVKVAPFCADCVHTGALWSKIEGGEFKKALIMKIAKDCLDPSHKS